MDPKRPPLWGTLMLAAACLVTHCADSSPVTQSDFDLLQNVTEDITCFSRTFEDLTCFWKREDPQETEETYRLNYTYECCGAHECPLTLEVLPSGIRLYTCTLPRDNIWMYTDLDLEVVDAVTNEPVRTRSLSLENVGLIDPPKNIHRSWTERLGILRVKWEPPLPMYEKEVKYELQYKPTNSAEPPEMKELQISAVTYDLDGLRPGEQYDISIRTKPDGISVDGFWGPWSPAVPMATSHSADDVHLDCFTSDLERVRCEWRTASATELYYKYGDLRWTVCTESGNKTWTDSITTTSCEFRADNKSEILVMVNATATTGDVTTYLKWPFWMYNAVRTRAPQILSANVTDDRLTLTWVSALARLNGKLNYEIGYSDASNISDWKILLIPRAGNTATIDVRFGTKYSVKIRAKPDGHLYSGTWSAWSEVVHVTVPLHSGWIMFLVVLLLLLFSAGAFLLLRCTFPSAFSKLKRKIWPPVPNLHRVLDGFLAEIQKQYQPTPSLYEKPTEDNLLPCLLEILSEEKTLPARGDNSAMETLVKLSHNMIWPYTPVLQRRPQPSEPERPHCPQQDYVVLAPSTESGSRYENEYCNGAVAHSGALGVFLVSVPKKCVQPHSEENGQYASFTRPWQVNDENHEGGTLWKVSDHGERQEWESAPMNTTDIANQSYLLTAGARDWGQ